MRIENLSKNMTVASDVVWAKKFGERIFGLIFKRKAHAMVFQTRFGLHSFFMRYAVDVVVLDKKQRVVKVKRRLRPNRIFLWNPAYSIVVELPEGSIERSRTERGDFWEII